MKYFSSAQIQEALRVLRPYNTFFGVTFLVLKKANSSIGSMRRLRLDAENKRFLENHYRVHPKSCYFFRVFRPNNKTKDWVEPNYSSTGLQAINTQTFRDAILHEKNDNTWGWAPDYVAQLASKLPRGGIRIPLFHLAVWMYRESPLEDGDLRTDVVKRFVDEFAITNEELSSLFQTDVVSDISEEHSFQELPVRWNEILAAFSTPSDVPAESSGTLNYLEADSVGPVPLLIFQPSNRLNLITGDNGLGKTFLLDLSWWALTQDWAGRPATPFDVTPSNPPYIKFAVGSAESRAVRANYAAATDSWGVPKQMPALSGLAVYAMLDGSFAVCDPANRSLSGAVGSTRWSSLKFTRQEVWDGKPQQIEGLIRDWVKWQQRPDIYTAYSTFKEVLNRVFPPDLGPLEIGDPVRIPNDSREIPTLVHPYASVPILFESAGVQRIITLAYLLVWAWEEHKIQARQQRRPEERQMVVLVDEAEAHLHPKWQRVILPALLGISSDLHQEMAVQWIIASHSPLVMASGETIWDTDSDALFHIEMSVAGRVSFRLVPFERRGTIDSWLSSDIFEIPRPGSTERETAIETAVELQQQEEPTAAAVQEVTDRLRRYLPAEDPFWVRWIFFAQSHGVTP